MAVGMAADCLPDRKHMRTDISIPAALIPFDTKGNFVDHPHLQASAFPGIEVLADGDGPAGTL